MILRMIKLCPNMNERGNAIIYAISAIFVVIFITYFTIVEFIPVLEKVTNVDIPVSIILAFFLLIVAAILLFIKTLITNTE